MHDSDPERQNRIDTECCGRCGTEAATVSVYGPDAGDSAIEPCGHSAMHLTDERQEARS